MATTILPNTPMIQSQLTDLIASANACTVLKHGPFTLYPPGTLTIVDRGDWDATHAPYNMGDQVHQGGYLFISATNGNPNPPLDLTTGDPINGWQQPWLSCYQRIRDEVHAAMTAFEHAGTVDVFRESVSGPWPCQNPSPFYDALAFYYRDTGHSESVTLQASFPAGVKGIYEVTATDIVWDGTTGPGGGISNPQTITTDPTTGVSVQTATTWLNAAASGNRRLIASYSTHVEWELVIGGTESVVLDGTFTIKVQGYRGNTVTVAGDPVEGEILTEATDTTTDPRSFFSIDISDFFPGAAAFTLGTVDDGLLSPGSPATFAYHFVATCTLSGLTVAPGVYKLKASTTADPTLFSSGALTIDPTAGTTTGTIEWGSGNLMVIDQILVGLGTVSLTLSTSTNVPGVDDAKQTKKIDVAVFGASGTGFGMQWAQSFGTFDGYATQPDGTLLTAPEPGLVFFPVGFTDPGAGNPPTTGFGPVVVTSKQYQGEGAVITSSTAGFWFGKTPPIASLGMLPYEDMPWNKFPTTIPTSPLASQAKLNLYLNYILPYVHGQLVDGIDSVQAYNGFDAPTWEGIFSAANELLLWPKRWKANVNYPKGWTLLDSYGNLQTLQFDGRSGATEPPWAPVLGAATNETFTDIHGVVQVGAKWVLTKLLRGAPTIKHLAAYTLNQTVVDDNGNIQTCTTAGVTGSTSPTWSSTLNGTTADGAVVWTLTRINPQFAPAVARYTPPVYPFFWQNPTSDWVANAKHAVGDVLTDTAGNTQRCGVAGTSGGSTPTWNTVLNGATVDGTVTWGLIRLEQPPLNDTNVDPQFPNPGHAEQFPFSFQPEGWWIYRVALNRIPKTKTIEPPPVGDISVTLGCMRNGSFFAFGTYHTGEIIDAMWPCFTDNTALCYQAGERVDVQAEIITCGLGYSMWGTVTYPMAAAYINDVNAIIDILNS